MSNIQDTNLSNLILYVLRQNAKFGNEITAEIEKLTENKIQIKQATLYNTLKKLEVKKYITSYWEDSKIGGKRHYYLLTDIGKEVLKQLQLNFSEHKQSAQIQQDDNNKSHERELESFNPKEVSNKSDFWNTNTQSTTITPPEKKYVTSEIKREEPINDYEILPEQLRKQSNDVISKTISQHTKVEMNNTDIDYKNILGELYISEDYKLQEKKLQITTSQESISTHLEVEDTSHPQIELEITKQKTNPPITIKIKNQSFSDFGIKVRKHSKISEFDTANDSFLNINSLNFFTSLCGYTIFALFMLISYFVIKQNISSEFNYLFIIVIITIIGLLYPLFYGIIYMANPHKKSKNDFNFKQTALITSLISVIFVIFVIAIDLLAGMNNLNQIQFLYFWLIPLIVAIATALIPCFKKLLILTKKFNA